MMMDGGQRFQAGEARQRSILERVIGAALLKRDVYEEVEADTSATPTAAAIVVLSSIAGGIGGLGTTGAAGLVAGVVIGLAGWAAWALITYFIGTRMLPGPETKADWGQLARTLGFARAPALLLVFAAVPGIGAAGEPYHDSRVFLGPRGDGGRGAGGVGLRLDVESGRRSVDWPHPDCDILVDRAEHHGVDIRRGDGGTDAHSYA